MSDRDWVRRASRAVAGLALLQFEMSDPHIQKLHDEIGASSGRGYFLVRAAPLGRANPSVVADTFGYFPSPLVAKIVGRAWEEIDPAVVVDATVRHLTAMAEQRWAGRPKEVERLVELLGPAVGSVDLAGRPLASAWRSVSWPNSLAAQLFGFATVVREYRGDGHLAAHQAAGRTGLEGYLLAQAGGDRDPFGGARSRSWRSDDLEGPMARLNELGLLAGVAITDEGRAELDAVEAMTDELTRVFDSLEDEVPEIVLAVERLTR